MMQSLTSGKLKLGAALAAVFMLAASPAMTQPAAAPPEDPVIAAARTAWEAMPEGRRRDIQEALVWTGIYKGSVDGAFGRMTHGAIQAWLAKARGANAAATGLDDGAIKLLLAQGAKARASAAFAKLPEPKSGVTIGVPQKLLSRREQTPAGMRFVSADGLASVETFRVNDLKGGLKQLFDVYTAPVQNRRVTYRVLRPTFFVIAAETPTALSYTRVAPAPDNPDIMRGFTMVWPKSQRARYDTISIAVANSFEPALAGKPVASAKPQSTPQPVAPPARRIAGTALAFSAERFVAVLADPACNAPRIGPYAARILKRDPQSGLVLIDADGAKARRVPLPVAEAMPGAQVVALYAAGEAGRPEIAATAAAIGDAATPRLTGALPVNGDGAIIVSRNGQIVGLAGPANAAARKLAAAANAIALPPQSRGLIASATVREFAATAGLEFLPAQAAKAPMSAGAIATALDGAAQVLTCGP